MRDNRNMPEITKLKCNKCGHGWIPTKEKPMCCPRCKSYAYADEIAKKQEIKENKSGKIQVGS